MARKDLARLDKATVEETKYYDSFSTSRVHNKNTWFREALGAIDEALRYFYQRYPFNDVSVETKQKSEMKHEEKVSPSPTPQKRIKHSLCHSNSWPVETTKTYLVKHNVKWLSPYIFISTFPIFLFSNMKFHLNCCLL